MYSGRNNQYIAKWSLLLVWLVIVVCLGQRAGFISMCSLNADSRQAVTSAAISDISDLSSTHSIANNTSLADKPCEMSDHLLQAHQQPFDYGLLYFSILCWLPIWLYRSQYRIPVATEPIPPSRRLHLTLCVFRE